ncbi:PREDICTED: probable receptor-like protein kinase At1g80640 [Erythranthe guttata]|uniref:probable receptor-like protein kinase At1g80640 n=1 Tax=Erythranthe guttata TaxID=4155 RepID=UPI00064DB01D|nr:PREDICTED: probable receptor-like protein kinase At1g80640 [Erythranthe guttata]|eukprot:XP_012856760.1 PREDICTED: probable receptor-like protein kinase At1g80640 [Erythranthe guttata]
MKPIWFVILIPIWVLFNLPSFSFSAPLDVKPDPPAADPVLPTEKDPFFKNSTDLIAHSPEVAEVKVVHHQDLNKKILVALVVSSSLLGGILLLLSCFSIYRLKRLKKCKAENEENPDAAKAIISFGPILDKFPSLKTSGKKGSIASIEYQLLVAATNNFDEAKIIGEGGLGRVYKAHFNDHFHAAVKKIYAGGQEAQRQFENEVDSLSKIQHQNVVSLLGYCIHGESRFLIYEMMENGSLEFHLHGKSHRSTLTWHLRMKSALDVARGLEYLHERCNPAVIHRDLKCSNILLDSNFNAKLSDFGLAITGGNSNKTSIKLSGTLGYVAPEYLLDGKLTDKSDVYAFGVVLLELLMGRRPVERVAETQCQSIVTWAMPQLTDRSKLPNIVDPAIRNTMDLKHLYQVAAIAVLCVQPEPSYRPLITDVLHSFIPLVPVDLGGSLRV